MKNYSREEAEEIGWTFYGPNPSAEKVLTDPYPHTCKVFGVDEEDLLRSLSHLEARLASNEHHANLY